MQLRPMRSTLLFLALAAAAGTASADTIHLVDGKTIDKVEIVSELVGGVSYKVDGKGSEKLVDADEVLMIEYSRLPQQVDAAETLVTDGALAEAADELMAFARGVIDGTNRKVRQKWAPAYAIHRALELRMSMGDLEGLQEAVGLLVSSQPDSRHVPAALVTEASALRMSDKASEARKTLEKLRAMIGEKGLSQRWTLELELAEILADGDLSGQAKRDRLIEVAGQAGRKYPTVRSRANLAEGQTFLEGNTQDYASARGIFEKIVADPKADAETLAGAFTGLGDCIYFPAAKKKESGADVQEEMVQALMAYMRVVVNYKEQSGYVPKAMFLAGRVFDFLETDEGKSNARRLYAGVINTYPDTSWADEARKVRR